MSMDYDVLIIGGGAAGKDAAFLAARAGFFFLIIHLRDFWYQVQFGHVPLDKDGQEDLYTLVVTVYHDGWYVLIYVLSMVALGYHLLHGSFSAARTLGFYNARYVHWVKIAAYIYSIGISAGFAIIPVYIYFARP